MCGIFGVVGAGSLAESDLRCLVTHAQQRGMDSSGLMRYDGHGYRVDRADFGVVRLWKQLGRPSGPVIFGHSRLVTNGQADNQPVVRDDVCVFHNGIIVNVEELWPLSREPRRLLIDTEIIAALTLQSLKDGVPVEELPEKILAVCEGVVACALVLPRQGKLCLFSNNGSLFLGQKNGVQVYASESYPLEEMHCTDVRQVRDAVFIDIPVSNTPVAVSDQAGTRPALIPALGSTASEECLLEYPEYKLKRCNKCLLPESMPFIRFDAAGVCNYCHNYKPRNRPKPKEELLALLGPYRRTQGAECIVPFSGGRDSCYGLHLIVNELKMRPITYTYDWGMVTDLGRRNVSRMSASLGVENIIVAADIRKKRRNIAMNLKAWLKAPHLGMISVLTAGDKHFFKHVETIKKQTGVSLNLWGVNPLEVTHFKAGFLGVPPYFEEERVYSHGLMKQLRYQRLRFRSMLQSPGYFNSSLWDTLSGEYYRSFTKKSDYFHLFDYWRWDEKQVDATLDQYQWERAPDTSTTWRIGDGTAAFYNYVYYTVAGFTEHDTFRSNQIREGDLTREEALEMVREENQPRYPNIKWYLDTLGMDFKEVISVVNRIPRLVSA
ncbi:glucosamine 6-phosphate synthetase [Castellaniella sp.]|uniref:glucosamine 6-phosphate synthetase n=1 Tax=Castellaniella sp. TaxID=1955812 RepID=UPI002AFE6560|nr:glucosamine 6-phosphate synthetase [Castellaniella sp.]